MKDPLDNPMDHPAEQQPTGVDGPPRFGRLLLVLLAAVALIVALTFAAERFYS
ncbi:MAG TPA: hypothetical protein VGU61_05795 [Noviherbaspirillum sp.]|jgi:hypothetical protein|uniref:hypothetical protein n=1 Tax=Noviherbaspirillum sp. TaxID=1926288 RepID=UPI002DDDBC69|nr:hypothetical protein [Noviherbaspirillum sp.]HEV2609761.1 hypothetical protein [Noviherbaspirillum sp.]